jgi:hypothetical protein
MEKNTYPNNLITDILNNDKSYFSVTAEMMDENVLNRLINIYQHRKCMFYLQQKYVYGLSSEEIASKYGCKTRSIDNSIREARRILVRGIYIEYIGKNGE